MTKFEYESSLIRQYRQGNKYSVKEVYTKPSYAKQYAEMRIKQEMEDRKGYGYKIMSHNWNMFSCAYTYIKDGRPYLVYHTKSKVIEIRLIEEDI